MENAQLKEIIHGFQLAMNYEPFGLTIRNNQVDLDFLFIYILDLAKRVIIKTVISPEIDDFTKLYTFSIMDNSINRYVNILS